MLETKAKRARGRPKGSKNTKPAKPRFTRQPAPTGIAAEIEELIEERAVQEAAGNGRDEAAYEQEALQAAEELVRPVAPPPPKVVLPDLFIHRVENGYLIRPAYAQGDHRTSSDVRTWVVATKEQLAELVVSLIADPVVHATPVRQSQDYCSPPLIVETGVGPMR